MTRNDWQFAAFHNGGRIDWNGNGVLLAGGDTADLMIARSTGVFWRHQGSSARIGADSGSPLTLDFISDADGQGTTYMLTENLQADYWIHPSFFRANVTTAAVGFGIYVTDAMGTISPSIMDTATTSSFLDLAPLASLQGSTGIGNAIPQSNPNAPIANATRPSSNHTGIFNMAFCDGRVEGINVSINLRVYCSQLTPNGQRHGQPPSENF